MSFWEGVDLFPIPARLFVVEDPSKACVVWCRRQHRNSHFVMGAIYLREVVRYRGVLVVRDGVLVSCHSIAQGASGLANAHGHAGSECDRVDDIPALKSDKPALTGAPEGILHWYGKMKGGPGVFPRKILRFKVAKTPNFNSCSSTQDTNQSGSHQNNC